MYLTLVDTAQIQPYIFGSNRLRENIGASYLVDQATGEWATKCLSQVRPGEKPLYAGGGNFVGLFDTKDSAIKFERLLTRKALCEAPGLQLILVHQDCGGRTVFDTLDAAFKEMGRKKQERPRSTPVLGLSVTRACASTGLPASHRVKIEDDFFLVSAEINAKHSNFENGNVRLTTEHGLIPPTGYRFPYDLEYLGASLGDQSYIAVVHADGNGMGDEIRGIGEAHGKDDAQYKIEIASFSSKVQEAALRALQGVLNDLTSRITEDIDEKGQARLVIKHPELEMIVPLKRQKGKANVWYLPFRPIVFGGDDVTFVCDGRLGVALAAAYLRRFEQEMTQILGKKLTACAGVAIVKSHYPFARAYGLAEDLCKEAKKYHKEIKSARNTNVSCLDWHFALSGLSGSIGEIRKREFSVLEGTLTLRPVMLDANPEFSRDKRSWKEIETQVKTFQSEQWAEKRNKMKALRDVVREGHEAVKRFKTIYRLSDAKDTILKNDGWSGNVCEIFDAIELADIYMPLAADTNKEGSSQA